RRVAARRTGRSVTRRIRFADVRLDLDDHSAGNRVAAAMNQNFAEEIARDGERRTIVKRSRKCRCQLLSRAPGPHPRRFTYDDASSRLAARREDAWPQALAGRCFQRPAAYACERPSASTVRK